MKFTISGKNIEVSEALRERITKKFGKLDKLFSPEAVTHITMSVERNRHILEATTHFNGIVLRAEVEAENMYLSIDKAVERYESQLRKYKAKLDKKLHSTVKLDEYAASTQNEHADFDVVRTKKFAVKPMTTQEAILQMNLLGHEFFMFSNQDTREVNVVYKRKDGNYGLIEPEFV